MFLGRKDIRNPDLILPFKKNKKKLKKNKKNKCKIRKNKYWKKNKKIRMKNTKKLILKI